jgi:UPF0716 family protein affecting phage T7 exclusion
MLRVVDPHLPGAFAEAFDAAIDSELATIAGFEVITPGVIRDLTSYNLV